MQQGKAVILPAYQTGTTMDLRRIRHFVVLAETLNFRRAAERLHMAQPPLSVSIQKLEAELGAKLFTRESSGVALTPSGRAVLVEAKKLLFHGSQLNEMAKNAVDGTGGTLHIGFVGSASYGMLQKLLPLFRAEYPGVELVLIQDNDWQDNRKDMHWEYPLMAVFRQRRQALAV